MVSTLPMIVTNETIPAMHATIIVTIIESNSCDLLLSFVCCCRLKVIKLYVKFLNVMDPELMVEVEPVYQGKNIYMLPC